MSGACASRELRPLPYHEELRAFLQAEYPEVWQWCATNAFHDEMSENARFELLKSTYRLERAAAAQAYAMAEDAARRLGVDVPITLYQAQNPTGLNASAPFVHREAHIVLHGSLSTRLSDGELRALLAHELSHLVLWRWDDGGHFLVEQVLAALTRDALAEAPHFAAARLWQLYSEIFCDRGALTVVEDPLVVVSMLLKVHTQLDQVSAESYLRQAAEIFRQGPVRTRELTHPETFIRAQSLSLWADGDAEAEAKIRAMIEGCPTLDNLDLLAQRRAAQCTRRLIQALLAHRWMRSESVLGHARLFFEDFAVHDNAAPDVALAADLRTDDAPMRDYYCYVLLDFVTADRGLEDLPLAAALALAEDVGLKERFAAIAQRELRLRKTQFQRIDREKGQLLRAANEAPRE